MTPRTARCFLSRGWKARLPPKPVRIFTTLGIRRGRGLGPEGEPNHGNAARQRWSRPLGPRHPDARRGSERLAPGGPLNLPLSHLDGGSVQDARISPDGIWVVYAADQNVIGEVELFSAPFKGGGPSLQLSPRIPGYEFVDVESWQISPDGQRVVYVTDDHYSVPIDRRALPVRLSEIGRAHV